MTRDHLSGRCAEKIPKRVVAGGIRTQICRSETKGSGHCVTRSVLNKLGR
jgi:hypothetical protein